MPSPVVPLQALPAPALLFDAGAVVIAANPAAEQLAGRPLAGTSAEDLLRLLDARAPGGGPLTAAGFPVSRALAGEEVRGRPIEVAGAGGLRRTLRVSAAPVRDGGRVAGAVSLWQDVTEERRAGAEREAVARIPAENPNPVLRLEGGRTITYANAAARALLGDACAGPGTDVPDEIASMATAALAAGTPREAEYRRGDEVYLLSLVPLTDRRYVNVYGTAITGRKRAESALRESEAVARSFFENMFDACAICVPVVDAGGEPVDIRVLEVNPVFLHGLPVPAELVVGRTAFSILPEMDRAWLDRFREVARTGSAVRAEEPFPALGRWYHVAAFPVRGGRIAVIFRDVTEQRAAEEALRENTARLREQDLRLNLALDAAAIGTFDWDPVTDEERWDDRIRAQWGLPPGAPVTHEAWAAAIHPDDRPAVAAANERALDPAGDGRYAAEYRVIGRCDGVERWISARGQVFFEDGRPVRMIGTTADLTGRKRAELALARYADDLRASQDRLQGVIAATGAGYFHLSLQEGQGSISPRGAELLGFSTTEMPSLLEIAAEAQVRMHPDDMDGVIGSFLGFVEAETERQEMEFRVRTPEGGWRWVQAIGTSAERDESGRVVALAGFLFDIDERKRIEAALRRSNEELQRFAYVASHDLQEPLRSIVSFSQLLERRYRGQLDADADDYIDFIVEGGLRMQQLITDLLRVSRIETAARPLEPTDAGAVVAAAFRLLETPIREAGATVTVGELPCVLADATQLEQVVVNLLGNAIKYRHPDRPPAIRISARRAGPMVEFAVRDNGIGIEAEYFDRIFEMFRRLHTHDEYEGTGIGLAVVKRIVERHGGTVRVESTPGEGTTFFFTLPAA
jgi:PAS domain S-box-containing protein